MRPQKHEQERLLHQAAVALLAVPIIAAVYVGALLRRSVLARVGLALGAALILGIGVIGAGRPASTVATPATPIVPLTQAAFTTTFSTDRGLTEPVTIEFSTPMDAASVAAAITVEPATPVTLAWDATASVLKVSPQAHWSAGTFHTITVQAGALATSGRPLSRPARAIFLTRDATTASAVATQPLGERVSLSTAFLVSFARPVDPETVETAIRLDPPTPGVVRSTSPTEGQTRYMFVPSAPLRPDVEYRLIVAGVRDLDGLTLDAISLAVRTTKAPGIVRFRPRADSLDVARDVAISVRFTEAMDRPSAAAAFSVSVDGRPVAGKIAWAESDKVLLFTPASRLPYEVKVSIDVGAGARSTAGVPLGTAGQGTFQTLKTPVAATMARPPAAPARAKVSPAPAPRPAPPPATGGGAVAGGSWGAVETYYLGLMNCTRTGGWVTSTGSCSSPGGRGVAGLKLDTGISTKVSRPYAKVLAVGNDCTHFIGGTPGDRLRRAGFTNYTWAENIGCRSGDARASVLGTHLFYQSEKPSLGGHYVNLMNPKYDRVGIGVWVSSGRTRLVIDFYHP